MIDPDFEEYMAWKRMKDANSRQQENPIPQTPTQQPIIPQSNNFPYPIRPPMMPRQPRRPQFQRPQPQVIGDNERFADQVNIRDAAIEKFKSEKKHRLVSMVGIGASFVMSFLGTFKNQMFIYGGLVICLGYFMYEFFTAQREMKRLSSRYAI